MRRPASGAVTLPVVKSAPRAICAIRSRSYSSRSIGRKRSAMAIITAISWEGIPTRASGLSSRSIPPTRSEGRVVIVRMAAPITSPANCQVT